jgi:hypothetical protein
MDLMENPATLAGEHLAQRAAKAPEKDSRSSSKIISYWRRERWEMACKRFT